MGKALDEKAQFSFLMTKLYRLPHLYIIVSVFLLNTIKQLPANIVFPHQCGMIWSKINLNAEFEIE